MTKRNNRTWREVISRWEDWVEATEQIKESIHKKCEDLHQLREDAHDLHYQHDVGSLSAILQGELDRIDKTLWEIYQEVDSNGSRFVSDVIGLQVGSKFHQPFLDYWMQSVVYIIMPPLFVDAEERFCFMKYGDAYRDYLNITSRWIGIPK